MNRLPAHATLSRIPPAHEDVAMHVFVLRRDPGEDKVLLAMSDRTREDEAATRPIFNDRPDLKYGRQQPVTLRFVASSALVSDFRLEG